MTASDRPFVTSRDPKGSHTLRLCAEAYDEAQFPEDRAQRLNDRGGELKERLAALFAELSNTDEFSDEERASEYQYPADFAVRPIREQVDALAALFPGLSLGGTMEYLEKLPPVPGSCDGYYAVPTRRHGSGVCVVGDAAGYVDVPSLKGIHYAMHSGILAARQIFEALKKGDTSADSLASTKFLLHKST